MTGIRTTSQTVVVVAMGLVSVAGAVALNQHAALPGPVAATTGLAVYLLLLTGHLMAWRRNARAGGASRLNTRDRRDQELRRAKDEARPQQPSQPVVARAPSPPPMPPPLNPRTESFGRNPLAGKPAADMQPPPHRAPEAPRSMPPPLPPVAVAPAAAAAGSDDDQDYWSFRPSAPAPRNELPPFVTARVGARPEQAQPELPTPRAAATEPPPHARPVAGPAARAPREADVEVIQDAIKRLLEEVNASEHADPRGHADPRAHADPRLPAGRAQHKTPEASVEQSIDALRMTADTMRSAINEPAAAQPPPLPPFVRQQPQAYQRPASPSDILARQMTDAISAGRIDVALEPILGLEDQQTRHYEVSVRLRDADGRSLDLTADGPDLRGTGLLPLFDGVRITRTAAVARRLEERGKGGSVFSAFSGESVADEHFLGELAETLHQRSGLATQLVLSFTQSDVRAFSTPEWDALADMRALGFRFALSHLTDLDMDFEAITEQGFAFVKLDANVFLSGLSAPSGRLPSSDVCRHLASHGLALVVDGIENDEQLARVFGFGVLLGQGQLFGGARPVRADVVGTGRTASAAA